MPRFPTYTGVGDLTRGRTPPFLPGKGGPIDIPPSGGSWGSTPKDVSGDYMNPDSDQSVPTTQGGNGMNQGTPYHDLYQKEMNQGPPPMGGVRGKIGGVLSALGSPLGPVLTGEAGWSQRLKRVQALADLEAQDQASKEHRQDRVNMDEIRRGTLEEMKRRHDQQALDAELSRQNIQERQQDTRVNRYNRIVRSTVQAPDPIEAEMKPSTNIGGDGMPLSTTRNPAPPTLSSKQQLLPDQAKRAQAYTNPDTDQVETRYTPGPEEVAKDKQNATVQPIPDFLLQDPNVGPSLIKSFPNRMAPQRVIDHYMSIAEEQARLAQLTHHQDVMEAKNNNREDTKDARMMKRAGLQANSVKDNHMWESKRTYNKNIQATAQKFGLNPNKIPMMDLSSPQVDQAMKQEILAAAERHAEELNTAQQNYESFITGNGGSITKHIRWDVDGSGKVVKVDESNPQSQNPGGPISTPQSVKPKIQTPPPQQGANPKTNPNHPGKIPISRSGQTGWIFPNEFNEKTDKKL